MNSSVKFSVNMTGIAEEENEALFACGGERRMRSANNRKKPEKEQH